MKAEVSIDYKGLDIIVDADDPAFLRLSIDQLKKCDNAVVEKAEHGWTVIIGDHIYHVEKGRDVHYGPVLYADLVN